MEVDTANLLIVGSFVFVSISLGVRWAVQTIFMAQFLRAPEEEFEEFED